MAKESPDDIVQITVRLRRGTLDEFDGWIQELNSRPRVGKANRNAVLLYLLDCALRDRPDLDAPAEEKGKAKR